MKKTIVMLGIVSLLTAGAAFAGENQAAPAMAKLPYNGITYFDLGPASVGQDAITPQPWAKSFNGITVFDLGQPATRLPRIPQETAKFAPASNGITVF